MAASTVAQYLAALPADRRAALSAVRKVSPFGHSVMFVKERPKTATGKIQKYILRAQQPAIAPQ